MKEGGKREAGSGKLGGESAPERPAEGGERYTGSRLEPNGPRLPRVTLADNHRALGEFYEDRVLFLPDDASEALRVLDVSPLRPFLPFALLVWGSRIDTFIRQLRIASIAQLAGPVAGFEFEADISFDQFRALCVDRADLVMPAIERLRELGHLAALCLPPIDTGSSVELLVEGPLEHAVFVGTVPRIAPEAA